MSPKVGVAPVRREQIVRATIRCLARDGYARLTMKTVSRQARVSQGILHYYFTDKRAILVAALETVVADLDRRVGAAQARSGPGARARLRALIRTALETAVHDREMWIVFVEFWGEMLHDARLRAINAQLYARMRRLVGALVERGVRAGDYRPLDVHRAAAVILGVLDGVSLQLTFDSRAFTVAEAARFCEEALVRYLARSWRNR
jgi:TetR/AcrR family transcriptional regulator, transcriptional repressor of bet genes